MSAVNSALPVQKVQPHHASWSDNRLSPKDSPYSVRQDTSRSKGEARDESRIKMDMHDEEKWTDLCRQASVERDPKKLLQLVTEINRLLAERTARLGRTPKSEPGK